MRKKECVQNFGAEISWEIPIW